MGSVGPRMLKRRRMCGVQVDISGSAVLMLVPYV